MEVCTGCGRLLTADEERADEQRRLEDMNGNTTGFFCEACTATYTGACAQCHEQSILLPALSEGAGLCVGCLWERLWKMVPPAPSQ